MDYTTKDILNKYPKLSQQRLSQLRIGSVESGHGKPKQLLVEDEDWFWVKGLIKYNESAIDKLNEYYKEKI